MPVMIFVAGAVAGGVVGLVAGAMFQRRSSGASVLGSRMLATAIAVIALVVATVALAESRRDRDHGTGSAAAASSTTTTATGVPASSTTTTTTPPTPAGGLITVPNVSHPPLTREDAEAIVKRAHFAVSVETLTLSNVPSGFVISQNPLPEAKAIAGSTVTLVVSAAA
jgi:hypothetical protein